MRGYRESSADLWPTRVSRGMVRADQCDHQGGCYEGCEGIAGTSACLRRVRKRGEQRVQELPADRRHSELFANALQVNEGHRGSSWEKRIQRVDVFVCNNRGKNRIQRINACMQQTEKRTNLADASSTSTVHSPRSSTYFACSFARCSCSSPSTKWTVCVSPGAKETREKSARLFSGYPCFPAYPSPHPHTPTRGDFTNSRTLSSP